MSNLLLGDVESLVRTIVVGILAYVALLLTLRVSGKRTLSQLNAFDFIVTVALGSTLATILISRDVSLAQGVVAFLVLIGLQFAITWSSVRSERVARLAKSEPRALVYRGLPLRQSMARERVVEAEVLAAVREHGAATLADVDLVVLETNGALTVVPRLEASEGIPPSVAAVLPGEARGGSRQRPPDGGRPSGDD